MPLKAEQAEEALIESVCTRLVGQVSPELVGQCEGFVRQFYRWVSLEDLAGRTIRDLCGAAVASWDFARERKARTASVRAYNPTAREHDWQSMSTVVEIVSDDMPFFVDPVGMELSRLGYGIRLSIVPVFDVLRDVGGRLAEVFPPGAGIGDALTETVVQFEVDRESDPERLDALVGGVRRVLGDVGRRRRTR